MINLFPTDLLISKNLDPDWIQLIVEAKRLGLTPEQIRSFLLQK
ncbi:MAG: anti-repressor SinI family protein [Bacillus sp. (in: firmicutes)]